MAHQSNSYAADKGLYEANQPAISFVQFCQGFPQGQFAYPIQFLTYLWIDNLDQLREEVLLGNLDMEAVPTVLHTRLQHRQGEVDNMEVLSCSRKPLLQRCNGFLGSARNTRVHTQLTICVNTHSSHYLLHFLELTGEGWLPIPI